MGAPRFALSMGLVLVLAPLSACNCRVEPTPAISPAKARARFNREVARIPALDQQWRAEGLEPEARARKAHALRHQAALEAHAAIRDPLERGRVESRNQASFGDPVGPSFEWMVEEQRSRGLRGDAIYEAIIAEAAGPRHKRGAPRGPKRSSAP